MTQVIVGQFGKDTNWLKELESAQELCIKLYFCERTAAAYEVDKYSVLARYGLSESYEAILPDVNSLNFKVECYGRRLLIAREILPRFPQTIRHLEEDFCKEGATKPEKVVQTRFFLAFLSSDHFFNPNLSLPYPYDIGLGYENVSKFFFWVRHSYSLEDKEANLSLRLALYSEFSFYLISQIPHASASIYKLFENGIFFRSYPSLETNFFVISNDYSVRKLKLNGCKNLLACGLFDLDTLKEGG